MRTSLGNANDEIRRRALVVHRGDAHADRVALVEELPRQGFVDDTDGWTICAIAVSEIAAEEDRRTQCREIARTDDIDARLTVVAALSRVAFDLDRARRETTGEDSELRVAGGGDAGNALQPLEDLGAQGVATVGVAIARPEVDAGEQEAVWRESEIDAVHVEEQM